MPIPDIQSSPLYDAQSVPDSTDWANITQGFSVTGLISGCLVTAYGTPAMGVAVSAGSVACSGVITPVSAASVTIPTPSASDRRDIIIAGSNGGASVVTGTPCGTAGWTRETYPGLPPVKPAIPSNCVFLAEVYVAATTTSIANANIEVSGTQLLVTSQYVTSFNNRGGTVTFEASDLESVFTAAGQIPVGTGSTTGELLTAGSVGTVLTSQGASSIPQWLPPTGSGAASAGVSSYNTRFGAVTSQASDVEGLFTVAGQQFVGTGSGTGELLAAGSVNAIFAGNGTASIPSWKPVAPLVESGFTTAGQLYVGTGSGTGELLSSGSVGTILAGNGATSVPSWQPILPVVEQGFTAKGQLLVGTGSGTGELLAPGTSGYVLTSTGSASIPSWQSAGAGSYPLSTPIGGVLGSPFSVTGTPSVFLTTASVAAGTWLFTFSGAVAVSASSNGQCDVKIAVNTATATFLGPTSNGTGFNPSISTWEGSVGFSVLAIVTSPGSFVYEAQGGSSTILASTQFATFANATGYVATRVA